jgi:Tol biopolymer transport system component
LGIGFVGVVAFFAVEEMFVFSLREDHPRSMFWLLAGLMVAGARFSGLVPGRDGGSWPADDEHIDYLRGHWRRLSWSALKPARINLPRQRQPLPSLAQALAKPVRGLVRASACGLQGALAAVRPLRRSRPKLVSTRLSREPGKRRVAVPTVIALLTMLTFSWTPAAASDHALQVVLTMASRTDNSHEIYTADGDGSDLHEITDPSDGLTYEQASWTPGGTRIIFAAGKDVNAAEELYISQPDGSARLALTGQPWRSGQPHMSPDGKSAIFTSAPPQYPLFGIFSLDSASLQVTNLSARDSQAGSADTDPTWSPDSTHVAFVQGAYFDDAHKLVDAPSQIYTMRANGLGRTRMTNDAYYNVDPVYSPDGNTIAYSSYRGTGSPANPVSGPLAPTVKIEGFYLVTHDLSTGIERVYNQGEACETRLATNPCGPVDGPAYEPRYLPDGQGIAYIGVLDSTTVCVCAVNVDGSNPRVMMSFTDKVIDWFDITQPGDSPATAPVPGSALPTSRLLTVARDSAGHSEISISTPDAWLTVPVQVPAGLDVIGAKWGADQQHILVTAATSGSVIASQVAGPAPPPGQTRQRHFTLGLLSQYLAPPGDRIGIDKEQVYKFDLTTGVATPLTQPGTEDWRDAIPDGEWRGNADAVATPDGRAVIFTNLAQDTNESFILREDLDAGGQPGKVLSLTNATAGAMPAQDATPAVSHDGSRVAFSSGLGGTTQIAVMSAADGTGFRMLTDDSFVNTSPVWSPDDSYLVYASYRGANTLSTAAGTSALGGWHLVRVDVATGAQQVLAVGVSPTNSPAISPDGSRIIFVSVSGPPTQSDLWTVNADGSDAHPLQVTIATQEVSVDWR